MHKFRNLKVKTKIVGIAMAVSFAVLMATSLVFFLIETSSYRHSISDKLASMASMIAVNSEFSLVFGRSDDARDILASLSHDSDIECAVIYDRKDRPFAIRVNESDTYASDLGVLKPDLIDQGDLQRILSEGSNFGLFSHGRLLLFHPVYRSGEKLGTVLLVSNLSPLTERVWILGAIVLALLAAGLVSAYLLASRLQRLITEPLNDLVAAMDKLSSTPEFTLRVKKTTNDEIGSLMDGFNRMLTSLEKHDKELTIYRTTLEDLVSSRTEELSRSNIRLRQVVIALEESTRQADAASAAKSQFLANMSHEIRTPMASILGMSEVLIDSGLGHHQHRLAKTIYESSESLLSILNDILDLSKIESGRMELESLPFDLHEVTEEALELMVARGQGRGLELVCHIASNVPRSVLGDALRYRQILLNLLGNAVKFTEQGEVVLTVQLLADKGSSAMVRIEVRDTGIGMSPEVQSRVFEAFIQGDGSTTRNYGGTGLGLAIVRQLTMLMDGSIEVESHPGGGTRIGIILELPKSGEVLDVKSQNVTLPARALIIDDSRAAGTMLVERLEFFGLSAELAADRASGLARLSEAVLEKHPFDLLLVDSSIPEIDFESFPETVRSVAPQGLPSIIGLVPRSSLSSFEGAQLRVLPKPIRTFELVACLQERLGQEESIDLPKRSTEDSDLRDLSGLSGNILLAEDNLQTQTLIHLLLKDTGCHLTTVQNGRKVIEVMQEKRFELLLLDIQMPQMDGIEVARRLRNAGVATPIVGFSAHARAQDIDSCLQAGMNDFLPKPFKQKLFYKVLGRWLGNPGEGEVVTIPDRTMACPPLPRILLVDDDPSIQRLIRIHLPETGYSLQVVPDGEGALRLLADDSYQLVLLDGTLPDMDGIEVTRSLRSRGLAMPVVALTGRTDNEFIDLWRAAGLNGFLSKPFKKQQLLDEVGKWISPPGSSNRPVGASFSSGPGHEI